LTIFFAVLFATEHANNPNGFPHSYVLQDLDVPTADRIRQIMMLADALKYDVSLCIMLSGANSHPSTM
jgi:hypothetical protein